MMHTCFVICLTKLLYNLVIIKTWNSFFSSSELFCIPVIIWIGKWISAINWQSRVHSLKVSHCPQVHMLCVVTYVWINFAYYKDILPYFLINCYSYFGKQKKHNAIKSVGRLVYPILSLYFLFFRTFLCLFSALWNLAGNKLIFY